ncbi:sugar transferase [Bacillus paranthracis]|uniref:sugar transferase n=1 Tax=Bacillus paranthracis TaxID=2026186 RepID=UPI000778787F|nr:exopolysaccharide biosynthesis polyprenyl glycosylphosphotransferase [Bacillus paranthracis]KXY05759.1 UDP-phosphate N-acetylgalactosaminyl-1-phosphate transferase [Bacillus cereus]MCC2440076.1 exopolysaccharide biosynthesis polyprenyl glycosylphosphotransferase [Bacillus paranthracis]MDG1601608.1 exopolysaccharide biosynthesis polyprenyl glycosylphosphotransferase [Bacillus paranthracis]
MKTGENIAREYQITPDAQNIRVESNKSKIYLGTKYLLDVMFSLVGLMVLMPVILIFSILIVLESPGSPFYLQERLGLNGKRFKVIKLRSMRNDAEKNGAKWAEKNDPRVTKIGLFIRKTRIDELPQLFNILKGDMSLVGPRPERPIFTEKFERDIPGFKKRLEVKPGLTGWAQVNGGYEITPGEKLELDVYYINHANLLLDFKIILKTIKVVITGEGAR